MVCRAILSSSISFGQVLILVELYWVTQSQGSFQFALRERQQPHSKDDLV
jgi:hypothetical protein